jgi:hypothetical protein
MKDANLQMMTSMLVLVAPLTKGVWLLLLRCSINLLL